MIKRTVLSLFFLLFALCSYSQSFSGFKVDSIGRQVKEFQLDSINLSSPLNYFLSRDKCGCQANSATGATYQPLIAK